jgi:hypothetical protein
MLAYSQFTPGSAALAGCRSKGFRSTTDRWASVAMTAVDLTDNGYRGGIGRRVWLVRAPASCKQALI